MLGIINHETWQSQGLLDVLYYLLYPVTIAELVVLVMMVNGLNGYMEDNIRLRNWQYSFRNLFVMLNHQLYLGKG